MDQTFMVIMKVLASLWDLTEILFDIYPKFVVDTAKYANVNSLECVIEYNLLTAIRPCVVFDLIPLSPLR